MDKVYEKIKKHILNQLVVKDEVTNNIINIEIENVQKIFNESEEIANMLFGGIRNLSVDEYEKIKNELEAHFAIKVTEGILIRDDSVVRDSEWWSSKEKKIKELYYWYRYKELMEMKLPKEVVRVLDIDTDVIMDNIEDPQKDKFARYGMVVGHVQSGKTGNYSGLICKAADSGYKFIVVIAGGMDNLRNQTQERLNQYFIGKSNGKNQTITKISGINNSKQPISLTTEKTDFNSRDADKQSINFDNINVPILLVIKKNVSTLKNVIKWIKGHTKGKISKHAMLIIDDEADYASINYKEEDDPTKINKRIRELISLFEKSSYVAYTATPFANIFIDHKANSNDVGDDLFPKHFIYSLDAPTDYMGAKKFFGSNREEEEENTKIVLINDYEEYFPLIQKKAIVIDELPESLKEAIRLFLLNIGVRHLKGDSKEHNSMLIHVSRFTESHMRVAVLVEDYLKILKRDIEFYGCRDSTEEQSEIIRKILETYSKMMEVKYSGKEIIKKLTEIVDTILVREVHQKSKLGLVYREDVATNVIAIGGTSLSRGYTLEGLSISYFVRNSGFYDTLMQMGRWFGYRKNYEELCKVYIPNKIAEKFENIIEATDELIESFKAMKKAGRTPEEFGLAVQYRPEIQLEITAKNKMRTAKDHAIQVSLDGRMFEETELYVSKEKNEKNYNVMKNIINSIEEKYQYEMKGANYIYKNIETKDILRFFEKFNFSNNISKQGVSYLEIIKEHLNIHTKTIDLVIFSVEKAMKENITTNILIGPQMRTMKKVSETLMSVNKKKISTSNPEQVLSSEYNNLSSNEIRTKMEKPLIMFYLLKEKSENKNYENDPEIIYPSFGISFPGCKDGQFKKIMIKTNLVWEENFQEEYEDDYDEE